MSFAMYMTHVFWKVCLSTTDQRPSKVHRKKSAEKRMVAAFFKKSALIKVVPLERGGRVNASWCVNTYLWQVFSAVSERRERRTVVFHDDNAKTYGAWMNNEFLLENHVEQYENPPYSPDWSLRDFLFEKVKKQLRGIRFND